MTQQSTVPTGVQFPPVPLATGATVSTGDTTSAVADVTVTVRLEDGSRREIPLEYRFGGWWVPADSMSI